MIMSTYNQFKDNYYKFSETPDKMSGQIKGSLTLEITTLHALHTYIHVVRVADYYKQCIKVWHSWEYYYYYYNVQDSKEYYRT